MSIQAPSSLVARFQASCHGPNRCLNTDLLCDARNTTSRRCNLICEDVVECEDEESCNGYRYGLRCNSEKRSVYVPSWNMCDGYEHCVNGADEDNCQLTHVSMTTGNRGNHYNNVPMVTCRLISGDVIPLFNFTRCGPRFGYSFTLSSETSISPRS